MARLRRVLSTPNWAAAVAASIILSASAGLAQPRPALSRLTADEQSSIDSACHFEKRVMGPQVYRECVQAQLEDLARTTIRPNISGLAPDDRNSIEWICGYSRRLRGPAAYYRCTQNQLVSLERSPVRPDTSRLLPEEQESIESACGYMRRFNGPGSYNRCVQNLLDDLARTPVRPDITTLPAREQISVEAVCSYQQRFRGPAAWYRCLDGGVRSLGEMRTAENAQGSLQVASLAGQRLAARGSGQTPLSGTAAHPELGALRAPDMAVGLEDTAPSASEIFRQFAHRAAVEWRMRRTFWMWLLTPALMLIALSGRMIGRWTRVCARCGAHADSHGFFCRRCLADINELSRAQAARRAARREYESCYAVLGIPSNASREQIRAAYRKEMRKYHPDLVAHLGDEIQEMAKRKAQALNRAYHQLVH